MKCRQIPSASSIAGAEPLVLMLTLTPMPLTEIGTPSIAYVVPDVSCRLIVDVTGGNAGDGTAGGLGGALGWGGRDGERGGQSGGIRGDGGNAGAAGAVGGSGGR